ncbi:MAG: hypothetical protein IV105_08830 [Rhizobacter sp.]|nr:hypothetical protein [Rhizobacter sp.]
MTRPHELRFHVRRLVVDAAVLEQAGLSAETLPMALQQALERRVVGEAIEPSPGHTVDRIADAVWSQLPGTAAGEP